MNVKTAKIILTINIIILILSIPGFILLNNYLEHSNSNPNNTTASPSPDIASNPNETIEPNVTENPEDTADKGWTALVPNEIDIEKESLPSSHNFKWDVVKDGQKLDTYSRNDTIVFGPPNEYNEIDGVTTFRGNNYRNSASYGFANIREEKLEKVWSVKIGYIDTWTGVGWNGQPSIVKWDDNLRRKMNLFQDKKNKDDLKEVIYATLDGKIYFLDLDDGSHTRNPINVGASLKGSVTVDPRGYPLLYSGQGIDEVEGKKVPIGFRIYSLLDQKLLYFINGLDNTSFRYWGAFDSSPLLHKETDSLFLCGENGLLYSIKLNTDYVPTQPAISINPDITKYRYTSPVKGRLGTENSIAAFKNFGYFADNSGTLQCVDLNTLSPVWVRNITDDTDSTMAIEDLGGSNVFVYIANEVDLQGENGYSFVRKINALTGSLLWEKKYKCSYNVDTNGGALASPVVGKNEISDLVIFSIAKSYKKNGGKLIAFDKNTGDEVWVIDSDFYSWSSPVDIYTKDGKAYIIHCDSAGYMNLIEGKSGKILDKIPLGGNVEGSPAVYNDMIVVGTRGQQIWGIKIK
ncbi:outer membrane protein assembly factor BamB family protein [Acetivibrio mesophilus]|uniref:Pyrrolo-quinoline quinone n=1 Tax=Acetivibrio mesophilus TaxID=2487273 RepID=A0A4Q0I2C3_9FIRM|nr:PQQ-binding-like beta-propeller repeat protein [Acetivibrio mesophilus]ODM25417.1 pyrrolo-quinoline quinone [Clostridium sp. Bc-iso-3]RXE58353.1 pyrrolo-quinoline quinone [Acetivibrio mesophilus]HHV28911.1 PQQ-like beta-propeller repeat protein [Clostridium sp.]